MNLVQKIERWGDHHHPKFLDIIRVALGIFLILKGIAFMENGSDLKNIIENGPNAFPSPGLLMAAINYASFIHIAGGSLIALGICTRFASFMQLPVVFGAIFFIDIFQSPFNAELGSSAVCMVLLIVFVVIGSGKLSLDRYLENVY